MRDILFNIEPIYHKRKPVRASSAFTGVVPFILEIGKSYDNMCLNKDLTLNNANMDISIAWQYEIFTGGDRLFLEYNYYYLDYTLNRAYNEHFQSKKIYIQFAVKKSVEYDMNQKCKLYNLMSYTFGLIHRDSAGMWMYGHANILFINKATQTVERYDPLGIIDENQQNASNPFALQDYIIRDTLTILTKDYFSLHLHENLVFKDTALVCPIGIQKRQTSLGRDGFCVTWSCYILLMKLLNPEMTIEEISNNIIDQKTGEELLNFILRFAEFMIHISRLTHTALYNDIEHASIRGDADNLQYYHNTMHYREKWATYQIALFEGKSVSKDNRMDDKNALKIETYQTRAKRQ